MSLVVLGLLCGLSTVPPAGPTTTEPASPVVARRKVPVLVAQVGHTGSVASASFSPDGKRVVTASSDSTARIWDANTGKELKRLDGDSNGIWSMSFSSDSKRLVTTSRDGVARIWDAESGKELCSLVSFKDGTWAVVDPVGRYDASNGGDVDGLHWVVGNEPIALKLLTNRYYEPGLLAKRRRPVDH